MKLENNKLVIESKSEIILLQDMIEKYIKSETLDISDKQGLDDIRNQLDTIFYVL